MTAFKNLKGYGLLEEDHIPFQIFKGCLPQIVLGLFLNTLSQILLAFSITKLRSEKVSVSMWSQK